MIRWSHFFIFAMSTTKFFADFDSDVPTKDVDLKATELEVERQRLKMQHRDSVWKLFARVCDTIAVFVYQGSVFYVQRWFYDTQLVWTKVGDTSYSTWVAPGNLYVLWLYIEIYTFYLYMLSAISYICYHQMREGVCCKTQEQSDMNKAVVDFLAY